MEKNSSESSRGRKRQRDPDDIPETSDIDQILSLGSVFGLRIYSSFNYFFILFLILINYKCNYFCFIIDVVMQMQRKILLLVIPWWRFG